MNKIQTVTRAYTIYKDKIFFFSDCIKAFCLWDFVTNQITILMRSPFEDFTGCDAFFFENYIYITSEHNLRILKYNIEKNTCKWIDGTQCVNESKEQYIYNFLRDGCIYFFPLNQDKDIWLYDIKKDSYTKIDSAMSGKGYYPCYVNGIYGTVDYGSDVFFLMDVEKKEIKKYSLKNESTHLQSIYCDGAYAYFLFTDQSSLLKYNLLSGRQEKYVIRQNKEEGAFRSLCVCGDFLLMLPKYGNVLVCIDEKKNVKHELHLKSTGLKESVQGRKHDLPVFSGAIEYRNWIYFPPYRMKQLFAWNPRDGRTRLLDMNCTMRDCIEADIMKWEKGELKVEGHEWNIDLFLDYIEEIP